MHMRVVWLEQSGLMYLLGIFKLSFQHLVVWLGRASVSYWLPERGKRFNIVHMIRHVTASFDQLANKTEQIVQKNP